MFKTIVTLLDLILFLLILFAMTGFEWKKNKPHILVLAIIAFSYASSIYLIWDAAGV